jgi:superfamily II DNA or RNA helicase
MASFAASGVAKPFDKIVWLANTIEQCEQARKAISHCRWPDPVEVEVHCVAARRDVSSADILVVDECHHLPAATWWEAAVKATGRVWGFSCHAMDRRRRTGRQAGELLRQGELPRRRP